MKKLLYRCSFIAIMMMAALLGVISCNDDFFERESTSVIKYDNIQDAEMGIIYPYNLLMWGSETSPLWGTNFIHLGMADYTRDLKNTSYTQIYLRQTGNQISTVYNIFSPSYKIISNCNYLIEFLETNPFTLSESDTKNNQNRLIGEAYFLRGYTYLQLASLYCPAYNPGAANDSCAIPLRLEFASSLGTALDNKPTETYKIYDQIVLDLKKAEELLPKKYESGMHSSYQYGRATKHAAMSVLAKVYMLMGNYTDALAEINGVLNDSEISRALTDDPKNCFTNNSTAAWTSVPEVIWYANFADPVLSANKGYTHPNNYFYHFNYVFPKVSDYNEWWLWGINKQALKAAGIIKADETDTEEWKADKRKALFKRWEGAIYQGTVKKGRTTLSSQDFTYFVGEKDVVYIANKYFLAPDSANYTAPFQNIPVIRSAELYLMRAGIKLAQGTGGQANDINIIRKRSWDEAIGGTYIPLNDAAVTWDVVDAEWIKEFGYEGDRVQWLQSFRKPIGIGNRSGVAISNPPYKGFYWPIYQSELDFQN